MDERINRGGFQLELPEDRNKKANHDRTTDRVVLQKCCAAKYVIENRCIYNERSLLAYVQIPFNYPVPMFNYYDKLSGKQQQ